MTTRSLTAMQLAFPLLTFAIGWGTSTYFSNKSIDIQELSTAIQITSSTQYESLKDAQAWAQTVIQRYRIESPASQGVDNTLSESDIIKGYHDILDKNYVISKDHAQNVCVYPIANSTKKPSKSYELLRTYVVTPKDKLFFEMAERTYRMFEDVYDADHKILDMSCGFLNQTSFSDVPDKSER